MTEVVVYVTDTETCDKVYEGPECVCELGVVPVRVPNVEEPCEAEVLVGEMFQSFVKPSVPIRYGAMGVHHVTEEMVADAPSLVEALLVSPFGRLDRPPVLVAHNSAFDAEFLREGLRPLPWHDPDRDPYWLDTWRVVRHVLPGLQGYANQSLRYELRLTHPDLPVGGGAHRAHTDALLTALLLRHVLRLRSLRDVCAVQHQPILMGSFSFGKHRGEPLSEVPEDYLRWLRDRSDLGRDEKHSAATEIERRRLERIARMAAA